MIDLHTHSTHSDGTLTPHDLVVSAVQAGLSAIALCDHNTVTGLPEFLSAAEKYGLDAVSGIEFSTDYHGTELHILGLFIEPEHYCTITNLLDAVLQWKEQSNLDLLRALKAEGIHLDYDKIKSTTPGGIVNRAVIAAEMIRLHYCADIQEAFQQWLSPDCGFFHPPKRLEALDTIRLIRSIGAISVLAHPLLNLEEAPLRSFLQEAKEAGLDAMETHYATFNTEQTIMLEAVADHFGLLPCGGSDFHGSNKPDISLGIGRGDLCVPPEYLDSLKNRLCQIRKIKN